MRTDFTGRTVIVTGASAGVGAAAAYAFAARGANLVLAARGAERLQALAQELGAVAVTTDVGQADAAEPLIARAMDAFGRVDILVNNAGCNHRGPVLSRSGAELAQIIDTNLRAPILLTRAALPHLKETGGAIVNVASLAGQIPVPGEATYSASKFGLRAFTYALAEELADSGVRASVVSPGPIETGFILDDPDAVPDLVFSQPMSTAGEIADLVVACAADGRIERSRPYAGHLLANAGYLFPRLPRLLRPALERKGRRTRERYRRWPKK